MEQAWGRCLPYWLNSSWKDEPWAVGGRVNDFPPGLRRTHYWPSVETQLGRLFVQRFADEYRFLLDRFEHGSIPEQVCAYDLLYFLAGDLYQSAEPLPRELRESSLSLLPQLRAELEDDRNYNEDLSTYTLGEVLLFRQSGGD